MVKKPLKPTPVRNYSEYGQHYQYNIGGDDHEIWIVIPYAGNVPVKQCVEGSLCAAERAVEACRHLQETFQSENHLFESVGSMA